MQLLTRHGTASLRLQSVGMRFCRRLLGQWDSRTRDMTLMFGIRRTQMAMDMITLELIQTT